MSDTTSNCAWVCSRCGAFVFGGTGHLCPSQRANSALPTPDSMGDVQNEILDNLRTIRDQTRQIAELTDERDRLRLQSERYDLLIRHIRNCYIAPDDKYDFEDAVTELLNPAALAASEPSRKESE